MRIELVRNKGCDKQMREKNTEQIIPIRMAGHSWIYVPIPFVLLILSLSVSLSLSLPLPLPSKYNFNARIEILSELWIQNIC